MKVGWNTKQKGTFHFLLYREKDDYVAVCLNLDLVEYGKDPKKLLKSIEEATLAHLEAVRRKNLPDSLLNRFAPQKYWRRLKKLQLREEKKPKISSLPRTSLLDVKPNEKVFFQITQAYSGDKFYGL